MLTVKLPKEEKDQIVSRLQDYFYEERSEEIGTIAAESILDYMIQELSPYIYNQAITDAHKLIQEKLLSLDDDLYALKKPIKR